MYKTKLNIVELESGEYHTLLQIKVSGRVLRAVLDSGASHSCIDSVFAMDLLPELETQSYEGVTAGIGGNEFAVRIANVPDFRIGRFRLPCYENMALIDFTYINMAYQRLKKRPLQMILGNDFLVKHRAVVDYKNSLLCFEK